MTPPFTAQPTDALMAAHTSVGLMLGSFLWLRRLASRTATLVMASAIVLAVVAPIDATFLQGIGILVDATHAIRLLKIALALAVLSTALTRRLWLTGVACVGAAATWWVVDYIQDSDAELAGLVLVFLGLLIALQWTKAPLDSAPSAESAAADRRPLWVEDVAAFCLGTLAGTLICWVVLHGWTDSGDEWADTFQAALFARFHAYGAVPHCPEAFRAFWVFQYMGRSFAQYTPGWPFFMAPFVALRLPWLAGPASLGLLAAGVARLARRAAAGLPAIGAASPRARARTAGHFAVLVLLLGSTVLLNGGSRYPHVFVAAMFAWCVEGVLTLGAGGLTDTQRWIWGAALGGCAALLLSARPIDGGLGLGPFVYLVYLVVRRRVAWRTLAAGALAFGIIALGSLVVLRLQLGKWFTTGYSLNATFYPWNTIESWSIPKANEYKWGIPLATGAYSWFPCSPAVGVAGLAALRGRTRRVSFIFFLSVATLLASYTLLEAGRGFQRGYGPRYTLPLVVPMAVGTGLVLAQLWAWAATKTAERTALAAGGPAAIALTAIVLGVVRIGALVYPYAYADGQSHNRLHEAIKSAHLHDAIVFAGTGFNDTDPMDLPENLPLEFYPNQDVLIAIDRGADTIQCVREHHPTRKLYRAVLGAPIRIVAIP